VNENDGDERDEVDRVDLFMAIFHEESRDKEGQCDQVHAPAENVVYASLPILHQILSITIGGHGVHDNAESNEERVLSEEQDDEEPADVPVSELVDGEVEDDDRLEAEEALSFECAVSTNDVGFSVKPQPTNHEDGHHCALEHDPTLLDSVSDRAVIGRLVKFSSSLPLWMFFSIKSISISHT